MDITAISLGVGAIVATFTGPIMALRIQRKLDRERVSSDRKMAIFRTLMSFRLQALNPRYIEALNLIDIEFCGTDSKEENVRRDWKLLLNHFFDLNKAENPNSEPLRERTTELTARLLMSMGKALNYDFDEVQVRKGAYSPLGNEEVENELHALRRALLSVLAGNKPFPVQVIEPLQSRLSPLSNNIASPQR
jgi:hypothetical protein